MAATLCWVLLAGLGVWTDLAYIKKGGAHSALAVYLSPDLNLTHCRLPC